MEREKRTDFWQHRQYSRRPHSYDEYGGAGQANAESKGMNPWKHSAQSYRGYRRKQQNMTQYVPNQNSGWYGYQINESRTRAANDMDTRQRDEQRDQVSYHRRTLWYNRNRKWGQSQANDKGEKVDINEVHMEEGDDGNSKDVEEEKTEYGEETSDEDDEGNTEDGDEDNTEEGNEEDSSEFNTASTGDNGDTQYYEAGMDKGSDLLTQIILKFLEEVKKVQNGLEDGQVNEAADASETTNQQDTLQPNCTSRTTNTETDEEGSSLESSTTAADMFNYLLKVIPGLEKNLYSEQETGDTQLPSSENSEKHEPEELDIRFPIPENYRGHQWIVKSAQKFELGTTGYTYEGQITDKKIHGFGHLVLSNEGDIIAGHWEDNKLMELESCKLHYSNTMFIIIKRFEDYLLTMYNNCFVATVTLNFVNQLDFNKNIWELKEAFFGNLTTVEILQDDLKKKRLESQKKFESLLRSMTGASADPFTRANTFILLRKYSSSSRNINNKLSDFINEPTVPLALRNAATDLQIHDSEYHSFKTTFKFLKLQLIHLDLRKIATNIYNESIHIHKDMLISICPSSLPSLLSMLQQMEPSKVIFITSADIDAFEQLVTQPFFQYYKDHFENLVQRFGKTLDKITGYAHPDLSAVMPIMSPLIEFLVRSLWELTAEISVAAGGCDYARAPTCELGNWKIKGVNRILENKSSFYHKSLEVQYNFISDMLKYILPDNRITNMKLDYTFKVLEQESSQRKDGRTPQSWLQKRLLKYRKSEGLPERYKNLSEGRLVWLYILDHTIHEVFKNDPNYEYILKQFDTLLQGHVRFIENSLAENYESFRALTHNIVKFITSSAPYIRVSGSKLGGPVDIDKLGVDVDILFHHIYPASQNIDHDAMAFSNYRDLITEYNKYLVLRNSIKIEAPPGHFSIPISQIMQGFMHIVESSLKKSVPTTTLVIYFRCLNDFLDDFRNIDFSAMWYVKTMGYDNPESLEKIDNKLSSGKNCSYRVINIEKFVAEYYCPNIPPPRHYIILIVSELLGCIQRCLDKQWQSDEGQLQVEQLKTAGVLMDAIRRSFMYLKEQPDYVDFNAFEKESVEPFARLWKNALH